MLVMIVKLALEAKEVDLLAITLLIKVFVEIFGDSLCEF